MQLVMLLLFLTASFSCRTVVSLRQVALMEAEEAYSAAQ